MKKSKSYTNLKSSSNNYLFESINNDKRRIDFPKDNNQNQNDELEYPLLNENSNNIDSSINKEKLNNKNKQNLQNEILISLSSYLSSTFFTVSAKSSIFTSNS